MATAKPASGVVRTVVADRDVRMLLVDLTAERVCDHLAGDYLGLSGGDDKKKPTPSETKKESAKVRHGRLFIEHCSSKRTEGDQVKIELAGRGWRWVDKASEKLGAKFEVSQYVRFSAKIHAQGTVDLSYARGKKVVTMVLTATEPVRAGVTPIGEIDANAKGPWSSLLGAASSVIGKSPDRQASKKFSQQGSQGLATKLSTGYTVAIDLCTGQKFETIGELADGALPHMAREPRGRRFKENERVELMPDGVDLSGPYKRDDLPFEFEIETEKGDGVVSEVICTSDAQRIADAFLTGKKIPDVPKISSGTIASGKTQTLRVEEASCDFVLYSRPAGKKATFSYLAYPVGNTQRSMVPCDEP